MARYRSWLALACLAIPCCLFAQGEEVEAKVAQAKKEVRMLDDLYKTAVVLVTENYVKTESDLAAGSAFKLLFKAMKEKGHHEARLVDATGEPYEPENAPADAFEKAAIKALKGGSAYYDQVEQRGGKQVYRAATAVPVVLKKCAMCHPAYEKAKPGEAIGAVMYVLPLD